MSAVAYQTTLWHCLPLPYVRLLSAAHGILRSSQTTTGLSTVGKRLLHIWNDCLAFCSGNRVWHNCGLPCRQNRALDRLPTLLHRFGERWMPLPSCTAAQKSFSATEKIKSSWMQPQVVKHPRVGVKSGAQKSGRLPSRTAFSLWLVLSCKHTHCLVCMGFTSGWCGLSPGHGGTSRHVSDLWN